MPQRSFLRVPFAKKNDVIAKTIKQQFNLMLHGQTNAETALNLIGVQATNVSKSAFTNQGFGDWDDISEATKKAKKSSQTLIDTGLLRGSITWQVRNN